MRLLISFLVNNLRERLRVNNALKILELGDIKYKILIDNEKQYKYINNVNITPLEFKEKLEAWDLFYKKIDSKLNEYNFDELVILYTPLSEKLHRGNEQEIKKLYLKSLKENDFILKNNINIVKEFYRRIFITLRVLEKFKDKNIKQIIYDPQELQYKNLYSHIQNYFFYSSNEINTKYFPFIEYGYFYNVNNNLNKIIDFVLGYTVLTKERKYIDSFIKSINLTNKEIYLKNKYTKENNYINYNKYYERLKIAKFTLIIPSYDVNEFSSIRFFEALALDCIPLIMKKCNWEKAFNVYKDFFKIIKEYLLIDSNEDIKKKINMYNVILKRIKESEDYKKLKDINYYKSYIKEF